MVSKVNMDAGSVVLAIGFTVLAANAMSAYYLHNPFLYCWFREGARSLYADLGPALLIGTLAVAGFGIFAKRYVTSGFAGLCFLIVNNMPLLAAKFFGLGVSCV